MCGINAHKLGYHAHKMNFIPLCLPIPKLRGVVYNENNKGPRTEPWEMPNNSLQRSDKVELIFID